MPPYHKGISLFSIRKPDSEINVSPNHNNVVWGSLWRSG